MSTENKRRPDVPESKLAEGDHPGFILDKQVSLIGQPTVIGFGCRGLSVRVLDAKKANAIIAREHYSRKVYKGTTLHLGVYEKEQLRGVLQFGFAMNPASQATVVKDTPIDGYLELNRMWLSDSLPRNSESRALSYAVKLIRRTRPKVQWIQSFADERCGGFGIVYQACNFLYLGEHTSTFWELDGVVYHNSILTDGNKANTPAGALVRSRKDELKPLTLRQFRYLLPLRKDVVARLCHPVKPYPKHYMESGVANDT